MSIYPILVVQLQKICLLFLDLHHYLAESERCVTKSMVNTVNGSIGTAIGCNCPYCSWWRGLDMAHVGQANTQDAFHPRHVNEGLQLLCFIFGYSIVHRLARS